MFVLIMLLVVSIIGISAARSTLMQERMSSNTNIRNLVFEAAESALAEGEAEIANNKEIWKDVSNETFKGTCKAGVCKPSTDEGQWLSESFWLNSDNSFKGTEVTQKTQEGNLITIEPRYSIEDLGQTLGACDPNHVDVTRSPDCPYLSSQRFFRVLGFAKAYGTQVTVQSTYLDPRSTRSEFQPIDLTPPPQPPKEYCDDGQERTGSAKCCPDHTRRTVLYTGNDACPEYCNSEILKSGEKCCDDRGSQYIHIGTECPKFCGPSRDKYLESTEMCCEDSNGIQNVIAKPTSTSRCPLYCDGKEHDGTKQCCTDPVTKKQSLQDSCPTVCADNKTVLKGNENLCCDAPSGSTGFNDKEQKCCADANGILTVIPKNGSNDCPGYCGPTLQPYVYPESCCNGTVYDSRTQGCCDGKTLFERATHDCCQYGDGVVSRIGIEECCDSTKAPVKKGDCPEFCPGGTTPKKSGELCCGPNPYNRSAGFDCCNGEIFNENQNQCCRDANNHQVIMPGPASPGSCPEYCAGTSEVQQSGKECCYDGQNNYTGQQASCPEYCRNPKAVNQGDPGACRFPPGWSGG